MDVTRPKKMSLALLAAVAPTAFAADVPSGVIAVPLTRSAVQDAYYAKFEVGTPPQTQYLKIDTGSPRYSFLDPRNQVCAKEGASCTTFGTFDNTTSTTCHYAGPNFQDALGPVGSGDYLNDTLVLGGVTMENMYFGYTSTYGHPNRVTGNVNTILGLSLECQFATGPKCIDKGPYFMPELKNASLIDTMSLSVYLGPDDADANAHLLFGGAYDKAKVDGDFITVDMVDPHNLQLSGGQSNSVNVTALEVVLDGGNSTRETYGEKDVGVPVLIDTGVASWYLTDATFKAVYQALGGQEEVVPGTQAPAIDCAYRDPDRSKSYISVEFGTAGKIDVPLHSLVTKFADGSCGSYIGTRGDTVAIFGDPFLRGTYAIFDQENWKLSMAQVKHTDKEEIVRLPEGGFKVTS